MHLFYDPELSENTDMAKIFNLNDEESWHCAKVLRLRSGDRINITNGSGWLFGGKLLTINPKACEIEVIDAIKHEPRGYKIHIAVAPVKNMSRFEWFLEKATEIGIDEITPLLCARSEKITIRSERLNKVITAAMKQSLGIFHPKLNPAIRFYEFIEQAKAAKKFIGWCETTDETLLSKAYSAGQDAIILIGPEGDFTSDEVQHAKIAGYLPISLGKNRLRTETAALAACFAVHFVNN